MEYQIQMVYEQEDVGALVRTLDFRRRPEKNIRRATKIGYPIFGILLIVVGISVIVGIVSLGYFAPADHYSHFDLCGLLPRGHCAAAPVRYQGNGAAFLGQISQ